MPFGARASLNRRSDAGSVVASFVRKLKMQEIKTRNGSFHFFPTRVTEGSGRCAMAFFKERMTWEMLELVIDILGHKVTWRSERTPGYPDTPAPRKE